VGDCATALEVGGVEHVEQDRLVVARVPHELGREDRDAFGARVLEPPPGTLDVYEAAHALVARLQELLPARPVTELAPDRGDHLASVVEVVDEPDQRWMDGRRELHPAAQHRCATVTRPSGLSRNR
jgi:hypothetical protein